MRPIDEWAKGYLPWLDDPNCLSVRFENLIGNAGRGNNDSQKETVRAITSHLEIEISENQIAEISTQVFFKKANTFRKGQIGDWESYFNENHKRAFKDLVGEDLIKLGYAVNNDW